jgi:exodeoxyribonuclease VII small subunit
MPKETKENLEKSFEKLEKINEELSSKDINVDEALKKFKEGASLIKECKEKLDKAENEFKEIKKELEVEDEDIEF